LKESEGRSWAGTNNSREGKGYGSEKKKKKRTQGKKHT